MGFLQTPFHRTIAMRRWQVVTGLLLVVWMCIAFLNHGNICSQESADVSWSQTRRSSGNQGVLQSLAMMEKLASEDHHVIELIQALRGNLTRIGRNSQHTAIYQEGPVQTENNGNRPLELNLQREKARRKAENTAKELGYFLQAQSEAEVQGSKLMKALGEYQKTLMDDLQRLKETNYDEERRYRMSQDLGNLVQRRLYYLQNPKDCTKAKKIVCNLHTVCGFACQAHHLTLCLLVAYATQRTLILDPSHWQYSVKGWESLFKPLSDTCTYQGSQGQRVNIISGAGWQQAKDQQVIVLKADVVRPWPEYMPLAIPSDLEQELSTFHGEPAAWWLGQLLQYIVRPNDELKKQIEGSDLQKGFLHPIAGIHVRRTDKLISEASYHSVDEYMKYVKDYFDQLERKRPGFTRRVYLASDDPTVLKEAKQKYPEYQFISDLDISKSAGTKTRYNDQSLHGIVMDIHFLSKSDFLVCTFSSNVCRMVYAMMQTLHGDASQWVQSLDDLFYYNLMNDHNGRVLQAQPADEAVMEMKPGDVIGIKGNHWNGLSKGLNRRTNKVGLYPSFKVESIQVAASMPTYPEVPRYAKTSGLRNYDRL